MTRDWFKNKIKREHEHNKLFLIIQYEYLRFQIGCWKCKNPDCDKCNNANYWIEQHAKEVHNFYDYLIQVKGFKMYNRRKVMFNSFLSFSGWLTVFVLLLLYW